MPQTQEKIGKKNFGGWTPWAPGRSLNGARMTFFEFSHTSTGHSFQAIDTKFFMQIALLVQQSPLKNFGGRTPLG
jgi:hypothetical protein